jgi:hypothetical protein
MKSDALTLKIPAKMPSPRIFASGTLSESDRPKNLIKLNLSLIDILFAHLKENKVSEGLKS